MGQGRSGKPDRRRLLVVVHVCDVKVSNYITSQFTSTEL